MTLVSELASCTEPARRDLIHREPVELNMPVAVAVASRYRDHGWMVRPPRRIQELQTQVSRAQTDLVLKTGHPPTAEEIAIFLDEDVHDVREAMNGRGCFSPASLHRRVGEDSGTLCDLLPMSSSGDESEEAADARTALGAVVSALSARDRHILRMRSFDA